jgi:hypothetical protein
MIKINKKIKRDKHLSTEKLQAIPPTNNLKVLRGLK